MVYSKWQRRIFPYNENGYALVGTHGTNSSLSSAVTLTIPDGANAIITSATGNSVRYTLDDTTPTSSVGLLIPQGTTQIIVLPESAVLRLIQVATTATLNYQFIRYGG